MGSTSSILTTASGSKEAHARMDLAAVGYQYNYKAGGSTNVFDLDSQNINANDRFDGWRTMYYSDLLGPTERISE